MKNNFLFLIFVLLLTPLTDSFSQGFRSIHTPDGTNLIAVGNNGLYFRSTNAGSTWASYTNGAEVMNSVFSYGDDVWIAANDGKIFRTFKVNSPLTQISTGTVQHLQSIFFLNGNDGFVCGNGGVIMKTVNGGNTWTLINSGIGSIDLKSINFKDALNGVVVGNNGNIFLTDDGGTTWTLQSSLTSSNLLRAKYFTDGIGITGEDGVIILKNGSGNFELINTRTDSDFRGLSGSSVNEFHVCGGGGFIRNNKNGSTNFFNFEINPMMADLVDIFYHNDNNGWAISSMNKVIIRTTNGGESWSLPSGTSISLNWELKLSPGVSGLGNNLCRHPYDKNTIYVMYGQKVYVSRDKGNNWTQIATVNISSGTPHSFYVSPVDTNIWLAAVKPGSVIRTTNYGQTWSTVLTKSFTTFGQPLEMDQNEPMVYYFAPINSSGEGVYKSTDNGATFNLIAPYNQSGIGSPCDVLVMWDSSNVIFLGDDGADVWKSTNGGLNWVLVKPNSSSEIPSMCSSVFKRNQIYATTWSSSQVFRTEDYGNNWSIIFNIGGSGWGSDVCREDPTLVLTASYSASAFLSTNSGAGFTTVSSGLSGAGAGIIVTDRATMIDQRTSGLYKMKIVYDVITDVNENIISASIPDEFNLYQNFPNPFNPSTKINFDIKNASNVKLIVYDMLGKEVMSLVNGYKQAGKYEVEFNANDLTSGVYYYKLEAENFISTKKMLLLK